MTYILVLRKIIDCSPIEDAFFPPSEGIVMHSEPRRLLGFLRQLADSNHARPWPGAFSRKALTIKKRFLKTMFLFY